MSKTTIKGNLQDIRRSSWEPLTHFSAAEDWTQAVCLLGTCSISAYWGDPCPPTLSCATRLGLTHKCSHRAYELALLYSAPTADAAFRNDVIRMSSLSPLGRIIYHLVLNRKKNNKKKSKERKYGKRKTWIAVTFSTIFYKENKELKSGDFNAVEAWDWPPFFVDFFFLNLGTSHSHCPAFLFTLGPTFWLSWKQLSVLLSAASQSKNVLMVEAWLWLT